MSDRSILHRRSEYDKKMEELAESEYDIVGFRETPMEKRLSITFDDGSHKEYHGERARNKFEELGILEAKEKSTQSELKDLGHEVSTEVGNYSNVFWPEAPELGAVVVTDVSADLEDFIEYDKEKYTDPKVMADHNEYISNFPGIHFYADCIPCRKYEVDPRAFVTCLELAADMLAISDGKDGLNELRNEYPEKKWVFLEKTETGETKFDIKSTLNNFDEEYGYPKNIAEWSKFFLNYQGAEIFAKES